MSANQIIWRKHPLVLISSIAVPSIQMLLPFVIPWLIARRLPLLYLRVGFTRLFGLMLFLCSVWTILHVWHRARRPPPEDETTSIGRRRAFLHRVTSLWRPLIIGGVILACLLTDALLIISLVEPIARALGFEGGTSQVLPVVVYYLLLVGWIAVETIDWRNDRYILTSEMIIDEVRVPILFEDRVMAPLNRVQNVSANTTPGILGTLFQVGKVEIETAAAMRAVIFEDVHRPHDIQRVIFERVDELEDRQRQQAREERTVELRRWFASYYELNKPIQITDSPDITTVGRPFSITWRVFTSFDTRYATGIVWDTVPCRNLTDYRRIGRTFSGSGSRTFRDEITPLNPGVIFFRAYLNMGEEYQSAEHHVRVV